MIREIAGKASGPTATALVVGSGGIRGVRALRALRADRLLVVEADPEVAAIVQGHVRTGMGEELAVHAASPVEEASALLHVLDNRDYSSVAQPAALQHFLPNLRGTQQVRVSAERIGETIEKLNVGKTEPNLLVLNVPGQGSALLESLSASDLQCFSWLVVRCSEIPLYEGESTAIDVVRRLHGAGFDVVKESPEAIYPERALLLARNESRLELGRLGLELQRSKAVNEALSARVRALEVDLDTAAKQIREHEGTRDRLREALDSEAGLRLQQGEQLEAMAAGLARVVRLATGASKARVASTEAIRKEILEMGGLLVRELTEATVRSTEAVSTHMDVAATSLSERVATELHSLARNIYRRVDRSTINAAKQVQAYIGIHEYLDTGELPSLSTEGHAWPISPDFAIRLVELIELNDYDLILEFGSGYSTVIMARALAKKKVAPSREHRVDLVSFEHLEQYLARTGALLDQAGVARISRLVHAPLEPWEAPNGTEYLYYECADVIRNLRDQYSGRNPRVLVVVDGPPGKTGRHARYPAAPIVLSSFKDQQVDFLVDDYARDEEKEVVKMWQAELSTAGVDHDIMILPLDKDACLLRVNPKRG